jgi:chemotaxis protein MotB
MFEDGDDPLDEAPDEPVRHDAWVIPYADLLTLLMAMFIALFAMSTVDVTKFKAFAIGFHEALGGGKVDQGAAGSANGSTTDIANGGGPLTVGSVLQQNPAVRTGSDLQTMLDQATSIRAQGAAQRKTLDDLQQRINDAATKLGFTGKIRTRQLNNGLELTLTDQVLFQSGQAQLQAPGKQLLTVIAGVLRSVDNPVQINGYTDNVPIAPGGEFPSNEYLSSSRAIAVADFFAVLGVNRSRLFPAARAELDPVASNDTAAGRALNRRVEIIVQSKVVQSALAGAGLDSRPVTPTTQPIRSPGAQPDLKPNLGGN